MSLPSHEDLRSLILAAETEISALQRQLTALALLDILVLTRSMFPTAAFIEVRGRGDGTGLRPIAGHPLRDGQDRIVATSSTDMATWRQAAGTPMANLLDEVLLGAHLRTGSGPAPMDDPLWSAHVHTDNAPWPMLDLATIERDASRLLPPPVPAVAVV